MVDSKENYKFDLGVKGLMQNPALPKLTPRAPGLLRENEGLLLEKSDLETLYGGQFTFNQLS